MEKDVNKSNGLAIAGFVLSLVGIITCASTSLLGIILSIVGLKKANNMKGNGKGMAIAGIVIGTITLIMTIIIITLTLTGIIALTNTSSSNNVLKKIQEEYTESTQEEDTDNEELFSAFIELDLDNYLEMIDDGEKFIILIARPTCAYCEKFAPILTEAKEDMNLTVYYLDTDKLSYDDWDTFESSISFFKDNQAWGTPTVLIIKGGETVAYNEGYVDLESIKKFFANNGY